MKNVREINKHDQENTNIYISGITFPGEWVTVVFFLVSNRALRRKMTGITKCPVTAKPGGSECSRSHGNTPHATFTALFISDYSFRGSFYPQWLVMAVLGFAEGLGCDLKRLKILKRKTLNPDIPLLAPGMQLNDLGNWYHWYNKYNIKTHMFDWLKMNSLAPRAEGRYFCKTLWRMCYIE